MDVLQKTDPIAYMWAQMPTEFQLDAMRNLEAAMNNCGDFKPKNSKCPLLNILFVEYARILTAMCYNHSNSDEAK